VQFTLSPPGGGSYTHLGDCDMYSGQWFAHIGSSLMLSPGNSGSDFAHPASALEAPHVHITSVKLNVELPQGANPEGYPPIARVQMRTVPTRPRSARSP
jgi:hypothetical protein